MNKDIIICGVGGQGTVLASKIIAAAFSADGHRVHSAETIGMAQRGGSVVSHVRIGEEAFSPLIPYGNADILLGFEPAEAVRNLKYLKKDGTAIVNTTATMPVTEALKESGYSADKMTEYIRDRYETVFVDADEVARQFGSNKFFNIVMLGVAAGSGRLGIDTGILEETVRRNVPAKYADINLEAFRSGLTTGSAAEHN